MKECIVMDTHLNFVFKQALNFSMLVLYNRNTMKQPSFKSFATHTTHPLERSILLVMYSTYDAFYCYTNN